MVEDEEVEDEPVRPQPWNWVHFAGVVANFGGNMAKGVWALFDDVKEMALKHAAVSNEQRALYEEMHRDLESLPVTE